MISSHNHAGITKPGDAGFFFKSIRKILTFFLHLRDTRKKWIVL